MPVHLVEHPLVHDALATLRDAATPPELFRRMAVRISLLLTAEATRDMPSRAIQVQTPLGAAPGRRTDGDIVVVPVLRAGLGMLEAVLELIPTARVGHIGLQRDEATAVASQYYSKLPAQLDGSFVLMIDPMLATGGSAVAALDLLSAAGARDIRVICIVSAPEGIALVEQRHPGVHIYTPAVDRGLNEHKFIVPGLGDFGDRLYRYLGVEFFREGSACFPAPSLTAKACACGGAGDRAALGAELRGRMKAREGGTTAASDRVEQRAAPRTPPHPNWPTALTCIEQNKILVRGYPLDEIMGRLTFGESIYLLLMGEIPSPGIGRLMEAMLVSFIDHGATPPSTLAARNTATTGAPLRACVAAGVLGFGRYHGGDIEACMQFLDAGLSLVRQGAGYRQAAEQILQPFFDSGEAPPGFGHRYHTRDPRAARLFQMALELEIEGEHIQMIRAAEMVLTERPDKEGRALPVNIDGAFAAVCGDLGLPREIANALFIISRVPGIAAHAEEERLRHRPMRQIDPKDHVYDGPTERRLPEHRK